MGCILVYTALLSVLYIPGTPPYYYIYMIRVCMAGRGEHGNLLSVDRSGSVGWARLEILTAVINNGGYTGVVRRPCIGLSYDVYDGTELAGNKAKLQPRIIIAMI